MKEVFEGIVFEKGLKVNTDVIWMFCIPRSFPGSRRSLGSSYRSGSRTARYAMCPRSSWTGPRSNCYDVVLKFYWPPKSLDLNPVDYISWGYFEQHTN